MFGSILKSVVKPVASVASKITGMGSTIPLAGLPGGGMLGTIGTIGSALSPFVGIGGTFLSNRQQIASAQDQMRFQKMMSDTSYQRAVKDMTKAGINPLLAVSKGGASSPAGAQPNIKDYGAHAATALQLKRLSEDLLQMRAQRQNIEEDTRLKGTQIDINKEQVEKVNNEIQLVFQQTLKAIEEKQLTKQKRYTERFMTDYQNFAANEKNYAQQELKMILDQLKGKDGPHMLKQRAFKGTGLWPTIHSIFSHTSIDNAIKVLENALDAIEAAKQKTWLEFKNLIP